MSLLTWIRIVAKWTKYKLKVLSFKCYLLCKGYAPVLSSEPCLHVLTLILDLMVCEPIILLLTCIWNVVKIIRHKFELSPLDCCDKKFSHVQNYIFNECIMCPFAYHLKRHFLIKAGVQVQWDLRVNVSYCLLQLTYLSHTYLIVPYHTTFKLCIVIDNLTCLSNLQLLKQQLTCKIHF